MKIILSRKGFDSGCGKMPSPILPDGTLLSLPIPDNNAIENTFGTLQYNGKSFYDIIHSVNPKSYITPNAGCHLDPDLRMNVRLRCNDWQPAFGQTGAVLGHLDNQGVAQGDLFLFFGWFRQTLFDKNRQLHFDEKASDIHVIYGYMQIGDIIREQSKVPDFLLEHPHSNNQHWLQNNAIFLPTKSLSFLPQLPGSGILNYDKKRVLTKEGCRRRIWDLPEFFKQMPISYHPSPWTSEGFRSAARGQEFVFNATQESLLWAKNIIQL